MLRWVHFGRVGASLLQSFDWLLVRRSPSLLRCRSARLCLYCSSRPSFSATIKALIRFKGQTGLKGQIPGLAIYQTIVFSLVESASCRGIFGRQAMTRKSNTAISRSLQTVLHEDVVRFTIVKLASTIHAGPYMLSSSCGTS